MLDRSHLRAGDGTGPDTVWAHLDHPAGAEANGPCVPLVGWVCAPGEPPQAVEVWHAGLPWHQTAGMTPRPDVAALCPSAAGAPLLGFQTTACTLGLTGTADLTLVARFASGRRVTLGAVRVHCPPGPAARPDPPVRPLQIVGFGRSGTTRTMALLRAHPEVVVPGPHPYEVRTLTYWTSQLRSLFQTDLSAPPPFAWTNLNPLGLTGGRFPSADLGAAVEREVGLRLGGLDEELRRAAAACGRPAARYYAEKMGTSPATPLVDLLYPTAKAVVLVRDFRDMFCSIRAFNARRGYAAFGRDTVDTDAEYIDLVAAPADWLRAYREGRRENAHLVRYEDLVTRPRETVRGLFEYLGVDASAAAVEAAVRAADADTAESRGHRTTASPEDSVRRWERDLEPDLRARIEDRMAGPLHAFGYLPDDAPRERGRLTPASPSGGAPPRSLAG